MLNIIILSIAAAILIGLNKDEVKSLIKKLFDTVISYAEIFGTICNNLKQRQQLPPPFNLSFLRSLIGVIGYGLLCVGMVWCIYANWALLRTRFEACMPFPWEDTLLALPGILAILITFLETVFFYYTLESWGDESFLQSDYALDGAIKERSISLRKTAPIIFAACVILALAVDVYVTYRGSVILMGSGTDAVFMCLQTVALSLCFGFVSYLGLKPFYVNLMCLLRNLFSFTVDVIAFIIIIAHRALGNVGALIQLLIEVLAKIGQLILLPFKKWLSMPRYEAYPVKRIIAILLLFAGLMTFLWSAPRLSVRKRCTVILVDMTGSFDYWSESCEGISSIIGEMMPGDRLYVTGITATSFFDDNLLLNAYIPMPKYTNELYSEKYIRDIENTRYKLQKQWEAKVNTITPDAQATDVVGAMLYASTIFANAQAKSNCLIVYSDLEDNVAQKFTGRFNDARVWCLYVEHKDFKEYSKKVSAWKEFFEKAGVKEKDIIIRIPAQSTGITIE